MTLWLLAFACAPSVSAVDTGLAAPSALVSSLHTYRFVTDWDGAPLVDGERRFETDLGYTVGLSVAVVSTTNLELVPCEAADTGWASVLLGRAAHAHAGHTHDVSQIMPDLLEDLVPGADLDLGLAPGGGASYCELYLIMGPATEAAVVSRLEGWYQPPGGEPVAFSAENAIATSALPDVGEGEWAALEADAAVSLVRYPARALDGLALEALSGLDLAYGFAWALGFGAEVRWQLDPS